MSNRKTTFSTGFDSAKFSPPAVDSKDPLHMLQNLKTRMDSAGVDTSQVDDPRNAVEKFLNLRKDPSQGFFLDILETIDKGRNAVLGASKSGFDELNSLKQQGITGADLLSHAPGVLSKEWQGAKDGFAGNKHTKTQDFFSDNFKGGHPYLSAVAGFAGDVAFDPTMYIPGGIIAKGVGKVVKPVVGALNGANRLSKIEGAAAGVGKQIENTNVGIKNIQNTHFSQAKANGLDISQKGIDKLGSLSEKHANDAAKFTHDDILKGYDADIASANSVLRSVSRGVEKQLKVAHAQSNILTQIEQTVGKVRRPAKGDAFYQEFKMLPREVQNSRVFASAANKSLPALDDAANSMGKNASDLLNDLGNHAKPDFKAQALAHPAVQKAASDVSDLQSLKQWMETMRGHIDPSQFSPATQKLMSTQQKLAAATAAKQAMHQATEPLSKQIGKQMTERELMLGRDPATLAAHGLKNLNKVQGVGKSVSDALGNIFVPFFAVSKLIGKDGRTAKQLLQDSVRNRDYLQSVAIREPLDVARKFGLSEQEMHLALDAMETPQLIQHVDPRIVGAVQGLHAINAKWLQIARDAGFNVSERENYVRHLLTDMGAKRLEQQGQKVSSVYGGGHGISTGKTKMEASRKMDGTVAQINASKGMDFFNPNAIQSTAVGSYEKATKVANAGIVKSILGQFGHEVGAGGVPAGWKVFEFGDKALYNGVVDTSKQIAIPAELHKELQALVQGIQSNALTKVWDSATNIWKSVVTTTPSFHIRNFMGNVFNNWLAGIKNPKYYVWGKAVAEGKGTFTVDGKAYTGLQLRNMFMEQGLAGHGQFSDVTQRLEDIVAMSSKKGLDKLKHVAKSPIKRTAQASRAVGQSLEEGSKITHFVAMLDRGMSPKQAALSVEKYLFDYSKLTDAERSIKRFIPFYTFTRKNLPLQLEHLFATPGKYTAVAHAQENGAEATGTDTSTMRVDLKNQLAIPLWKGADGNTKLFAPNLPLSDLAKLDPTMMGDTITSMLTPAIKIPIEQATNMSSFTKRPIENYAGETKPYFGMDLQKKGAAYWLDQIPLARTANSYVSPSKPGGEVNGKIPVVDSILKDYNQADSTKYALLDKLRSLQAVQKNFEGSTGQKLPTMAELKKSAGAEQNVVKAVAKLAAVKTPKPKKPKKVHAKNPKVTKSHAPSVHAMKKVSKPKSSVQKLKKLKNH